MTFHRVFIVVLVVSSPVCATRMQQVSVSADAKLEAMSSKFSADFLETSRDSSLGRCIEKFKLANLTNAQQKWGDWSRVRGDYDSHHFELFVPFKCPSYTYNDSQLCLSENGEDWPSFSGPADYISAGAGGFTVAVQHGDVKKVAKSTAQAIVAYTECLLLKRLEFHNVPNVLRCEALCMDGTLQLPGSTEADTLFTFVVSPFVENAFQAFYGSRIDQELVGISSTRKSLIFNGPADSGQVFERISELGGWQAARFASRFEIIDWWGEQVPISSTMHTAALFAMNADLNYPVTLSFNLPATTTLEDSAVTKASNLTLETGFKILQADVINLDLGQNILYNTTGDVMFIDFGKMSGKIDSSQSDKAGEFVESVLMMLPKSWWVDGKAKTYANDILRRCPVNWTNLIKETIGEYNVS